MELIIQNFNLFPNSIISLEILKDSFESRLNVSNMFFKDIFVLFKRSSLFKFNILSDLFGIDYRKYLQVNYYFLSVDFFSRLLLKNKLLSSLTFSIDKIFIGANWLEREAWDMYGIFFNGSLDLRRILTDYGFDNFPLLKIFPLSGFLEFIYFLELKKVSSKRVELTQHYRVFNFGNNWIINLN